jgi:hypothetical protein
MDNQEKLATLAYPEIEGTFPNNYSSYLKAFFVFILFFTRVIFLTTAKMVPGVAKAIESITNVCIISSIFVDI